MKALSYILLRRSVLEQLKHQQLALQSMVKEATLFINAVENGDLSATLDISDSNDLAVSLLRMRDHFAKVNLQEKQRRWITEGLTYFNDILRTDYGSLELMASKVLSELIDYSGLIQGALFTTKGEGDELMLELVAAYAYSRRKLLEASIRPGEGLVGQIFLEGKPRYITKLPPGYLSIHSGLGERQASHLFLVPLIFNDEAMGVLELASFEPIGEHIIEFIVKASENIAASISRAHSEEQTRRLLSESQQQANELRQREEEMRQNMEELQATQEAMRRAQEELQRSQLQINGIVNSTTDSIMLIDREYKITFINDVVRKRYANTEFRDIDIGFDALALMRRSSEELMQTWKAYYDRGFRGERYDFVVKSSINAEQNSFRHYFINPVYQDNVVVGVAIFSHDVTQQKLAEEKIQKLLEEVQQNEEKLTRQQNLLNGIVNFTQDSIILIATDYTILFINKVLRERYKGTVFSSIDVGVNVLPELAKGGEEVRNYWKSCYDRGLAGETFDFIIKSVVQGEDTYRHYFINPVIADDKIIGVASVSRDITTLKNRELAYEAEVASLKENLQALEEELRQLKASNQAQ